MKVTYLTKDGDEARRSVETRPPYPVHSAAQCIDLAAAAANGRTHTMVLHWPFKGKQTLTMAQVNEHYADYLCFIAGGEIHRALLVDYDSEWNTFASLCDAILEEHPYAFNFQVNREIHDALETETENA